MAAFFQEMRAGKMAVPPPISMNVSSMIKHEGFIEFEGLNLADLPGVQEGFYFAVKRRIAKHKPQRKHPPGGFSSLLHSLRVLEAECQRLFAEDVLSRLKRHDGVLCMVAVERADEHPVHILPAAECGGIGTDLRSGIHLAPKTLNGLGIDIEDRSDPDSGICSKDSAQHGSDPEARTQHADPYRWRCPGIGECLWAGVVGPLMVGAGFEIHEKRRIYSGRMVAQSISISTPWRLRRP